MSRYNRPDFRNDYKGENPPKKLMRLTFWLLVRQLLGKKRFLEGPHLVLPSREAGDVSVLLGMDVPIENIVAVEWHPRDAALARMKFPGLEVIETDVGNYARRSRSRFASAFLDFCSWATPDCIDRTIQVARRIMQPNSLIACNFQGEREKKHTARTVAKLRREVEEQIARMKTRRSDLENMEAYFSRAFLIQQELEKAKGVELRLESRFFYSSKQPGVLGGHRWCGQLFWVNPTDAKGQREPQCYYFTTDADILRDYALDLEKKTKRAGLLLNVPKTSMAAWKAHQSRGTYVRKLRAS